MCPFTLMVFELLEKLLNEQMRMSQDGLLQLECVWISRGCRLRDPSRKLNFQPVQLRVRLIENSIVVAKRKRFDQVHIGRIVPEAERNSPDSCRLLECWFNQAPFAAVPHLSGIAG